MDAAFLRFLAEAVVVSLSGVMAPGPMTVATIGAGSRAPYAGVLISLGHGAVEFPLMALVLFGLGRLFARPVVALCIGLLGGIFLLYLAFGMLRNARSLAVVGRMPRRSGFSTGILLSAGNPYFLLWWATVGAALVSRSVGFGVLGVVVFAFAHWLCDFVWCSALAFLSFRGVRFFGGRLQQVVFALCGLFLIFFGIRFIVGALRGGPI